jgi:L-galactose dehydrogenase
VNYRTLGRTGMKVSIVGFGTSPLGGVFGKIDENEGVRAVHKAVDAGINFFDSSPYYGATRAETVLGRAVRELSREQFYLATKVGRYGDAEFNFSSERVKRSVDESLRRLNVDYIDLIQCHDIEFGSLKQVVYEALPALREVIQQGKARFVGVTGLPLKIFNYVIDRASIDAILSYCHYSLNDTSLQSILPVIRAKGIGVISASPLSMGLLTRQGPPRWHPAPERIRKACTEAAAYLEGKGVDIAQLALQFAVSNPDIDTVLVGISSPRDLESNLKALDSTPDPALLEEARQILKPILNETWPSGRLENHWPDPHTR